MRVKNCPNPGYLLFSLLSLSTLSFVISYHSNISPLLCNFYILVSLTTLGLCILTFLSDASLASSKEHRPLLSLNAPYKLCETCKLSIDDSTQHCTQCGICIFGFQNHCILLSTCIGQSNKKLFCLLLCCLQIWCASSLFMSIYEIIHSGWWYLLPLIFIVLLEGYLIIVSLFKVCIAR